MAADFDKPTLDSDYANAIQEIRDNDAANALMFAGVSVTNIPVGAIQFAGGVFGTWNGANFDVTPVVIGGGGTGSTTAAGARANLSLSSVAEANALYMKILSNGSDIDDVSIFRTNIEVYSTSQVYTQEEVDTIVAFSSQAQAEAGTNTTSYMNPLRTSQAIQAIGRTPATVWTGSQVGVSSSDVLSSSGHIVQIGTYWVSSTGGDYSIMVASISALTRGTTNPTQGGTSQDISISSLFNGGSASFFVFEKDFDLDTLTGQTISEIRFIPL